MYELCNMLVHHKIPCYVSKNEDEPLDSRVIQNKLVFTTFHQVKGLERSAVVIFNLDAHYFRNKPHEPPAECPNLFYVALTRAVHTLVIYHCFDAPMCSFVRPNELPLDICSLDMYKPKPPAPKKPTMAHFQVSEMVRYLPTSLLFLFDQLFSFERVLPSSREESSHITMPSLVQYGDRYEQISALMGTAVMIYFEMTRFRRSTILDHVERMVTYHTTINDGNLSKVIRSHIFQRAHGQYKACDLSNRRGFLEHIVRGANLYESIKSFFVYNLIQIESYDWIDEDIFVECARRIQHILENEDYECEKMVNVRVPPLFSMSGFIDILTPKAIYEVKCTRQFTEEHKLQVIVYSYLQARSSRAIDSDAP